MGELIPKKALSSATHLSQHNPILHLLARVAKIEELNALYDHICKSEGELFIDELFQTLQVEIKLDEAELERIPKEGPFIVVANHPFGALDGLALLHTMRRVRPDFKMMANFVLQNIEPIRDLFLAVNPFEGRSSAYSNVVGMKMCLRHVAEGHALGIFPSGEVSHYQLKQRAVVDREWQKGTVKMIQRAQVPVVPVFFDGRNSRLFQMLGYVHPSLRTLALPSEMLKKKGGHIALRIGKPILPKDTAVFESASTYGRYLRAKTYALGKSFEIKREFFRRFKNHPQPEEIIPAVPLGKIMEELETGARYKLFEQSDFDVYVFPASHIPHLMREIGRLREITFRAVGEGTNRSLDLDEYDLYYDHLVVWDRVNQAFVGAYRIGNGYYINGMFGQKGFYINSLFKMKREMRSVLRKSAELGRSFVVQDYQRHRLALFLLWKGILAYLAKHKQLNYIIGPVSISNEYRELSKDLIVSFLERNCWDERLARWVKPRHPFKPHQKVVDKEVLLSAVQHDVKVLDKIISDLEPKGYTMPVLLKKYLQQNAKIICFNSDPKFNDALDGFMVLNIQDLPEDLVENLKIEMVKS